jgi:hypothetical protein
MAHFISSDLPFIFMNGIFARFDTFPKTLLSNSSPIIPDSHLSFNNTLEIQQVITILVMGFPLTGEWMFCINSIDFVPVHLGIYSIEFSWRAQFLYFSNKRGVMMQGTALVVRATVCFTNGVVTISTINSYPTSVVMSFLV